MSAVSERMLTSTGERRIVPNLVIKGGIARVTRFTRGRSGLRVHYVYENAQHEKRGEGWMLWEEWSKLKRSHKKPVADRGAGRTTAMLTEAVEKAKTETLVIVIVKNRGFIDYCLRICEGLAPQAKWNSMFSELAIGVGRIRFLQNDCDLSNHTAGLSTHVPVLWDHAARI